MDFPIVSFDPATGLASIGIPKSPRPLRGIDKLVQIVVIALLKNLGQDVFTPNEGSGLRSLIGQFNYTDSAEIKAEVLQRVNKVNDEILRNQTDLSVPATEKLRQLRVLEIAVDVSQSQAALRLRVISEAGQTTDVLV